MQKEIFKGTCTDISNEGKGIVRYGNEIVFVDGIFPGEVADIQIDYHRAGVYFGSVIKLHTLSKNRIQPKCRVCTSCGGCQYQQLDYQAQLLFKRNRVVNALKHIGKLKNIKVKDCIGMDNPYNYRNKIQLPYGKDKKGNIVYGFFKQKSHDIIPVKKCYIEDVRAESILWDIKELLKKHKISIYNEDNSKGIFRYALIRTSHHYQELMVVLVVSKLNFEGQRNFVNDLTKLHPEITSLFVNENHRNTNVILGDKEKLLFGKEHIKDSILGLDFEISPSSFYQVNPIQVEKLYQKALELIDISKNQIVLDAYSGVGTIGMIASKNAKEVICVEINKSATKNGIENAKRNGIKNIKFVNGDAGKFISEYDGKLDVVIMDPPRKGSDKAFLDSLIDRKIKSIIYISCEAETLARDILYLSDYYDVTSIQPVDMFPMTAHVEVVSLLELKEVKE